MAKRAAIYARFSSDLQRDRSIDDQIALCRDYAGRNGYEIVATFEDRALSGSSMIARRGIQSLLAAAKTQAFDFVIAESLSRIARDQEDGPAIRKRLNFNGVKIVTPSDGEVSPLMHGLRTIIDSQYLEDMKGMIRRGMKGVVRDGRHAGGRPYGYKTVPGRPGELEIDKEAAPTVRRIFERFASGASARDISDELNRDRVPPPRGEWWRASTLTGDSRREYGILRNRLYTGRNVWNRGHYVRDPDSGARIRRRNPESEWLSSEIPHLRIIDDAIFARAAGRLARCDTPPPNNRKKPRRLLSGLLRCGRCGAGMSIKDYDCGRARLVCTQMKEAGPEACGHRRAYYADEIEGLVVDGLRSDLGSPEALAIFTRAYNDERQRLYAGAGASRERLEARLVAVESSINRAVAAVIANRITEGEAEQHLPALRSERDGLIAELEIIGRPPKVISLHRSAVETYLRDISRLAETLNGDLAEGDTGASNTLRSLVETVTIVPAPTGQPFEVRVEGQIAALLADGTAPGGLSVPDSRHHQTPRENAPRFVLSLRAA